MGRIGICLVSLLLLGLSAVSASAEKLTFDRLFSPPDLSGSTRTLLTERGEAWVSLNDELTFLKDSPQFIWSSSRTGFRHLYLYQNDGPLVRALTGGEWNVVGDGGRRALKGVDEKRGLVYFTANAETPLERHLYSAPLREPQGRVRRLTGASGWHSVTMSEDARIFLDTYSTPERPPSLTLRSATGKVLDVLVANELNAEHPYARYVDEHAPTEFGTLKAADGQDLHYRITRPRVLEPGRRYPVIVDVYGGPESQNVRRAWTSSARSNSGLFQQILVQNGYIVFSLDNRGTGFRGISFEAALHRKMGTVEVEDQVRGVEYLRTLPYVDPARIGIFGWSYGGYMALMCAMQAPDHFAAAVAGAPVTGWELYDTHYTERYMGTPGDNLAGYAAGTVMTRAGGLKSPLLVMHGMADDNVLFTNSTALFKNLQDLGKPFDIMAYPGSKHGLLRMPGTGRHAYETVMRFFDDKLGVAKPVDRQAGIAVLEKQVAAGKWADEWEKGRLLKAIDDLRIEAAAEGSFSFSKISYRSTDGLSIPAYLFAPLTPAAGKTGAVIYVHGSQHGQFNSRSLPRVRALLERGWVVMAPDYRSSSGYTREFHDAADYGGREIDDMLAARDYLASLPQVDSTKIAILGFSHGGYNTLMALAVAPGSFAAGVDFFGPTDLVWRLTAKPGENPNAEAGDREYFARMVGKSIDDAPELYRSRSPRFLAEKIVDPLLILHGEKDSVVLVKESEWLAEALERAGHRDFALHVIKDGEHGYPAAQMDEAWNLATGFLGRVLAQ